MSGITYEPSGRDSCLCTLLTPAGAKLTITVKAGDPKPELNGDDVLTRNHALVENVRAFGESEYSFRRMRAGDKRESYRKRADEHAQIAMGIGIMVDSLGDELRVDWCSACFKRTIHRRVERWEHPPRAYLCESCGAPTSPCVAPRCSNMANRGVGRVRLPRYCAEHRHEIPGFDKADMRFSQIDEYADFLAFERKDLSKATRVAGAMVGTAAIVAPAAMVAAPAIGGALGASALGVI